MKAQQIKLGGCYVNKAKGLLREVWKEEGTLALTEVMRNVPIGASAGFGASFTQRRRARGSPRSA